MSLDTIKGLVDIIVVATERHSDVPLISRPERRSWRDTNWWIVKKAQSELYGIFVLCSYARDYIVCAFRPHVGEHVGHPVQALANETPAPFKYGFEFTEMRSALIQCS